MPKSAAVLTSNSATHKLEPGFREWNKAGSRALAAHKDRGVYEHYFSAGDSKMPQVRLAFLRPLRDLLLVRRLPMPPGTSYAGLLEIPESAQRSEMFGSFARTFNQSTYGVVIRTGPGRLDDDGRRIPCEVGPGDFVMWGKYIDLEDGDLVLISEKDVRWVMNG